ncbi:PadR family transcriptional regulator [Streptosporangium sp. NPDC050855]|uniref:PadR family transcriptional regulator n=1 Tax=Streptosporangium sp. NPDC050855 TaxID=3366194 RepID=UPI0037936236
MPTRAVLELLLSAGPDDPPWGYRICEETGLGPGTVYPILERLEKAGYVDGYWEAVTPTDRPRRRLYVVSGTGRQQYAAAQATRRAPRWGLGKIRPTGGAT